MYLTVRQNVYRSVLQERFVKVLNGIAYATRGNILKYAYKYSKLLFAQIYFVGVDNKTRCGM